MQHALTSSFSWFFAFAAASITALGLVAACTSTTVVTEADPAKTDSGTTEGGAAEGAGARPTTRVEGTSGALFAGTAKSFATVDDETGVVVTVGYTVPVKAFSSAPAGAPFQDDLVLEMPKVARDQTILNHVRVNWLASGHGPVPYGEPHFDFHFHRGTIAEVDTIDCRADTRMPPATALPEGYGAPELCVSAMGMHSWPKADRGSNWKGSIIMGYWATKVAFIEPMISKAKLLEKKTFELAIGRPQSTGGIKTLYPRLLTAAYDQATESYAFEFSKLEEVE